MMAGRLVAHQAAFGPGGKAGPGIGVRAEQVASKKDRLLGCLNKLNDRDTQKRAADSLAELLQDPAWLDSEFLGIAISSLCATGPEQKVFARKEVAKALARFAINSCPCQDLALVPPYLSKLTTALKRLLQDADSSVREAAAESIAVLARGMCELGTPESSLPTSQHPIGKALLECLPDGKRELQVAACQALGLAAPYLGSVDPALVKELIKRVNTPSFQAAHALVAAIGRTDPATGAPLGLIMASAGAFQQQVSHLVGQPAAAAGGGTAQGSGLCACLGSKDWQTRKAASDCVRCAALVLGPLLELEGSWAPGDPRSTTLKLLRCLEPLKYDKVKEVRDTAREAAALMEELVGYGRAGGDTAGWAGLAADQVAAKGLAVAAPADQLPLIHPGAGRPRSPARRAASPGAARPASPPRQSAIQRQSSLAERFRRAAGEQDVVVDLASKVKGSAPDAAPIPLLPQPPSRPGSTDGTPAAAAAGGGTGPGSRPVSRQSSGSRLLPSPSMLGAAAGKPGPPLVQPPPQQAPAELIASEPSSSSVLPAPVPPHTSISINRGASGRSRPPSGSNLQPSTRPSSASLRPLPPPASTPSTSMQVEGHVPGMQTVTVPLIEWQGLQRQLRDMESRQRELLDQLAALSASSSLTISQLQDRVRELEGQVQLQHHQQVPPLQPQLTFLPSLSSGLAGIKGTSSPGCSSPTAGHRAPITASPASSPVRRALPGLSPSSPPSHPHQPLTTPVSPSAHLLAPLTAPASPTAAQPLSQPSTTPPAPLPGTPARARSPGGLRVEAWGAEPPAGLRPSLGPPSPPAAPLLAGLPEPQTPSVGRRAVGPLLPEGTDSPYRAPAAAGSDVMSSPQSPMPWPLLPNGSLDVCTAYQAAIQAGPHSADMQRLLSRTGPVWGALQPDLAHRLLHAFSKMLQDPFTLPRVMPWLWRLADEREAGPLQQQKLSAQEQEDMLAAVTQAAAAWQQAHHPEMASKLLLLHQTLQSHWTQDAASDPNLIDQYLQGASSPARGAATWATRVQAPSPTRPRSALPALSADGVGGVDKAVRSVGASPERPSTAAPGPRAAEQPSAWVVPPPATRGSPAGSAGLPRGATDPGMVSSSASPSPSRLGMALEQAAVQADAAGAAVSSLLPPPPLPRAAGGSGSFLPPAPPPPSWGLEHATPQQQDIAHQDPAASSKPLHHGLSVGVDHKQGSRAGDELDASPSPTSHAALAATFGGLAISAQPGPGAGHQSGSASPVDLMAGGVQAGADAASSAGSQQQGGQEQQAGQGGAEVGKSGGGMLLPLPPGGLAASRSESVQGMEAEQQGASPSPRTRVASNSDSNRPSDSGRQDADLLQQTTSLPSPHPAAAPAGVSAGGLAGSLSAGGGETVGGGMQEGVEAGGAGHSPALPASRSISPLSPNATRASRSSNGGDGAGTAAAGAAAAGDRVGRPPRAPRERSPSGIVAMPRGPGSGRLPVQGVANRKQELVDLERDFMQSPAFKQAQLLTEAAKERVANVSPPLSGGQDGQVSDELGNVLTSLPAPQLFRPVSPAASLTPASDVQDDSAPAAAAGGGGGGGDGGELKQWQEGHEAGGGDVQGAADRQHVRDEVEINAVGPAGAGAGAGAGPADAGAGAAAGSAADSSQAIQTGPDHADGSAAGSDIAPSAAPAGPDGTSSVPAARPDAGPDSASAVPAVRDNKAAGPAPVVGGVDAAAAAGHQDVAAPDPSGAKDDDAKS